MAKKNTSKNKESSRLDLGSLVAIGSAIVATIIGLIALDAAQEANRIASQGISPQILVLDASNISFGAHKEEFSSEYTFNFVRCVTLIRVANLGGADTDIVSLDAHISLGKKEVSVSSLNYPHLVFDNFIAEGFAVGLAFFVPREIAMDYVLFENPDASVYHLGQDIPIPIKLQATSTTPLYIESVFIGEKDLDLFLEKVDEVFRDPSQPVVLTFEFVMPNSDVISIPSVTCSENLSPN